jgi:class 3 adenylate cyclase
MTADGRGTATVLFTDIVGSTELRVRAGDNVADELFVRFERLLGQLAEAHDGTVVKGLGDGIMASFNGAADAVLAAMEMQRATHREGRRAADDRRVEIRVGISAGDVTWQDGDCHGTPVVTASRLCNTAVGGQILCDDLVRGLGRGNADLTFRIVGELQLKGLPEPVVAFTVPWELAAEDGAQLPGALRALEDELPFAGRDAERSRLTDIWKQAQVEGTSVALLSGEPGVGKTRLASELARAAHRDGALVVLGRCDEHVAGALAPWIEALRTVVAEADEAMLREHVARRGGELARIVPEIAVRIPGLASPQVTDVENERFLLFDAVVDVLGAAAAERPLLFVFDDAHWADAASVNLLRHVVAHLPSGAQVLVVVTYRDTDIDRSHALAGALADLRRTPRVVRVDLHGLDEDGMRALLAAAGGHDLDDNGVVFARRLVEETEGNPFFVREVLRHLIETGTLIQEGGRWVGTVPAGEAGLPEGVRDVVGRRLSRLSEDANAVLRVASVIGREFDAGVVAAVVGCAEDDAVDRLDEALTARLIDEVEGRFGRFTFSHALVRSTLVDELSTNKRIRLHRQIAEALVALPGSTNAELAHHFCEAATAGVAAQAVRYSCAAGREARDRLALDEAVTIYERALDAIDGMVDEPSPLRAQVLADLALAVGTQGDVERARRLALEVAELARSLDDPVLLAAAGAAYQGNLGMWATPGDPVALDLMREALAGLGDDHAVIRARTSASIALGQILAPADAGLRAADEAVALARASGDATALCEALGARSWSVMGWLPAAQRQAVAEELVSTGREFAIKGSEWAGLYLLGKALVGTGDLNGADASFAAAGTGFTGIALEGWAPVDFRSSRAFAEGRYADGEALGAQAYELGEGLGDTNEIVDSARILLSCLERGDRTNAAIAIERAETTAIGMFGPYRARFAVGTGDVDAGRVALATWIEDVFPQLPGILRCLYTGVAVPVAVGLRDVASATVLGEYLMPFRGELIGDDAWIYPAVDHLVGACAAVRGQLDDAIDLMRSGHAMHERLGLRARLVHSGLDLGRVLLERAAPGDREAGEEHLRHTVALADELGMTPYAREATSLL